MKKILVILTIGLSFVPLATAQAKLRPGFSFGLKGAFNVSEFSGTGVDEAWQTKVGFAAGGFLAYRFGDGFALQPEIFFSQKGAKIFTNTISEWLYLNYIEIPLLFKFYPPLESAIRPVFFAGPYLALKSSFKDKWEYGGQTGNDDAPTIRDREVGFIAGGGLDFPIAAGVRMSAELRYSRGISTLSKDAEEKSYNSVFAILIGVAFGKKE